MKIPCYIAKYTWRNEKTGQSYFIAVTSSPIPEKSIIKTYYYGAREWHLFSVNATHLPITQYPEYFPLMLDGEFEETKEYGWELILSEITESIDARELAYQYLTKSLNLTAQTAETLVIRSGGNLSLYGEEAVGVLVDCKEPHKRASRIIQNIKSYRRQRQIAEVFAQANIPFNVALKVEAAFGEKAAAIIMKNPFSLAERFKLKFENLDRIFKKFNAKEHDEARMRLAGDEAHRRLEGSGHTYQGIKEYLKVLNQTMNSQEWDSESFLMGNIHDYTSQEGMRIYRKELRSAEERIFDNLVRLCRDKEVPSYSDAMIREAEEFCGISYGSSQRACFSKILGSSGVKLLIGGPGVGKTTTIKGILYLYQKLHPTHVIKLCAPTGRAAQRMSEQTEMEATTIHRLLEFNPYKEYGKKCRDESDPILADLLVVDEMSMTDAELCDRLLRAVRTGTTVIFVGDINQLEPVGPGAVLRDMLFSSNIKVTRCFLREVFRQSLDSPIVSNAYEVNRGGHQLKQTDDFQIIRTKNEKESFQAIVNLSKKLYTPSSPFETQVLCPTRKGEAGITAINKALQGILNSQKGTSVVFGSISYKKGDKVIMMNNNYDEECPYFNGDIGSIKGFRDRHIGVEIRGRLLWIPKEQMDEMNLAYGMTIHKSQGSEFENVILYLPIAVRAMLLRNLTYTAITRAKKKIWIIDEQGALDLSIDTDKSKARKTFLSELLQTDLQ